MRYSRARPFALQEPALLLVTDVTRLRRRAMVEVVRAAVDGGVSIVQLRDKTASHEDLLAEGRAIRDAINGRALFFVNGDVDAALELEADGVHLPEASARIEGVRALCGERLLISCAVHDIDAALRTARAGADLLQAGTLFETASKPGTRLLGLDGLREVCAAVHPPVIAIGGVTAGNAGAALVAGAAGVAVIGAIFDAGDARAAARELRTALAAREVRSQ